MSTATLTAAPTTGAARAHSWASYARISPASDLDGRGAEVKTERQHDENTAYILARDPLAQITYFTDERLSGWADVWRPDWEDMLARVGAKEFRGVVGWHADRLTRQVEVMARIVNGCERTRTELHTAMGGYHEDPTRIYMESIMAEGESRVKSNRNRAKHRQLAKRGAFSGGVRRYGYEAGNQSLRLSEAAVIRDIAARILNGENLSQIAGHLNDTGVPTASAADGKVSKKGPNKGKPAPWRPGTIRAMMLSERLIAVRVHHDEREETVTRHPAAWPAILDEPTFRAVGRKLATPEDKRRAPETNVRKYLLSGIATCGECGRPMNCAATKTRPATYRCLTRGCGKVARLASDVDAVVREYVVARLTELDANGLMASDESNRERLALDAEAAEVEAEKADMLRLLETGGLSAVAYAAGDAALNKRAATVAAARGALTDELAAPIRALEGATGPQAAAAWARWEADTSGGGLARRRAIVRLLVTVVIDSAGRGAKTFDPDLVRVTYRPPVA